MKHFTKIGFILCIAAFLTGCATRPNVMPPASFTSHPKKILIAQLSDFENAIYIPPGRNTNQGLIIDLIDLAIIYNAADIGPSVCRLISAPIIDEHYSKRFNAFYQGHNFDVTFAEKPIRKDQLDPSRIKEDKYAPYDFSYLKDQYHVDYALILDITKFSATRLGYLAKPHGRSSVKAYLVNLLDNSIVGEYSTKEITEAPKEKWDTPPEYYALTQAVRHTLINALDQLYDVFSTGKLPK